MKASGLVEAQTPHPAGRADISRPDQPDTGERDVRLPGDAAHDHLQKSTQSL
jgi:hypothetical protein